MSGLRRTWSVSKIAILCLGCGCLAAMSMAAFCSTRGPHYRVGGLPSETREVWSRYADAAWGPPWSCGVRGEQLFSFGRIIDDLGTACADEPYAFVIRTQAGWPLRCFEGGASQLATEEIHVANAWLIIEQGSAISASSDAEYTIAAAYRLVPYNPLWGGLIFNSLFFGVIAWLSWLAPFLTRRLIRCWGGRCIRCGDDLRHTHDEACPNCGTLRVDRKRLVIKLAAFLLVSVAVNVAVAWGCILWSTPDGPFMRPSHEDIVDVANDRGLDPTSISDLSIDHGLVIERTFFWTRIGEESFTTTAFAAGLPLKAFTAQWSVRAGEFVVTGGLRRPEWLWPKASYWVHVLPLRPVFPGFIINTTFYAVILWLLWSAPFATRRLIRKRRGRCIRCGYDLRGAEHEVCPECGR